MSGKKEHNNKQIDALKRIDMFLYKYSPYTNKEALLSVHVLEESTSEDVVLGINVNLFNIGAVTRKESVDGEDWIRQISDTEECERNSLHDRLTRHGFRVQFKGEDVDTWVVTPVSQ